MRRGRPLIAVTGPDRGGWPAWIFTAWAIRRSGGRPIRVTPERPRLPRSPDGVVLGGGADIGVLGSTPLAPSHEEEHDRGVMVRITGASLRTWVAGLGPRLQSWLDLALAPVVLFVRWIAGRGGSSGGHTDAQRDRLEVEMLREADRRGLPVLGICRGAQLINRVRGGTLLENLQDHYVERPQMQTVLPRRPIRVDPGTRLHAALKTTTLCVNSLHRHAVGRPGDGLRVAARELESATAANGRGTSVVQAIESIGDPVWIGVQWHPEYLPQIPEQRALFEALVDAAAARPSALSPSSTKDPASACA